MKNNKMCVLVALMLIFSVPATALPNEKSNKKPVTTETNSAVLIERLEDIKAVDKHSITTTEKKELRKEVKSIKKQLKKNGGGVYLSAGAVILIVLLLIILL
ncbi:hypothetical protein [Fulvivirga lutimaris]|uniref:hypothetical protein n=1 Tax=Fulvivirga lutimaris TaxID=1819566 RepID=UPI0012BCFE6D|nr:hypothetical protein [Fulvivirga lutimaris]MTI41193.1 hypothetical protein [Fulvivirga lutimaris]